MKRLAGAVAVVLLFAVSANIANAEPRGSRTLHDIVNFWEQSTIDCD